MSRIRTGCAGFRYPHWQESYYPEDLPEDWQLTYYTNEFQVVLLDQQDWSDIEWLEEQLFDLSVDLKIYCRVENDWPQQSFSEQVVDLLNERFAGWVDASQATSPGYIDEAAVLRENARSGRCWVWLDELPPLPAELIMIRAMPELKQLRQQLESVQPDLPADCSFVLDVKTPEIQWLQQMKTLLELMAIA